MRHILAGVTALGLTTLGLTGGSLAVMALTWPVLVDPALGHAPRTGTLPGALGFLCAATLALAWGWWVLSLVVCLVEEARHRAEAVGPRPPGHRPSLLRPSAARRLAHALLGGGLSCLLVPLPAVASDGATPARASREGTAGHLPLPVRQLGGPPRALAAAPDPTVLVRSGDTLWSIAARRLGPQATDAAVDAAWRRIHLANRSRIGRDPDLIHPGTRLRLPDGRTS